MLQVIFQSLFCDAEWRHTCGMVQKMKKETEYYIEISKEVCDYLERLSYDIETRKSIITRLFDEAKSSSDDAVLKSPAFQSYHAELEEAAASYETAKKDLEKFLDEKVKEKSGEVELYNWNLEDFRQPEVHIVIVKE